MINSLKQEFENLKQKYNGHCFLDGSKNILISAPHAVEQTRDGNIKPAEQETAFISLYFNKKNYSCIIKTTNNNDDANHEINCKYKNDFLKKFKSGKFNFLLDIHQLSSTREMDFCIGTGGKYYNTLLQYSYISKNITPILENNGYIVEINNPFGGGKEHTNSGFLARQNYPAIQLEINSKLLYNVSNEQFLYLLNAIEEILIYIEKEIKWNF